MGALPAGVPSAPRCGSVPAASFVGARITSHAPAAMARKPNRIARPDGPIGGAGRPASKREGGIGRAVRPGGGVSVPMGPFSPGEPPSLEWGGMRRRIVTLVAGFTLILGVSAPAFVLVPPDRPLGVGDVAPALEVSSWLHGEPVKLFAPGTVYVIEFWATWCGPCVANVPHLTELARAYPGRVTVIGATSPDRLGNTRDAVGKFVAARGARLSYHIVWLPESTGSAGEAGIPFNPWFRQ